MSIELVAENGRHYPIPRGWILLTLSLSAWGVTSLAALCLWWLSGLLG